MSTLAFLVVGFGSLILAFALEGGHLGGLLVLTAGMIVFGGTLGAVGVSYPWGEVKVFPTVFRKAFTERRSRQMDKMIYFIDVAGIARREGILSLEKIAAECDQGQLAKVGLQLVADGAEQNLIRGILEQYVDSTAERHEGRIAMFDSAGGFAPTMGIIGTVMGLVHVLSNLSDPKSLGPAIAVAFIATLYGVASANLLWLPIAGRLKVLDKMERAEDVLVMEAVLMICEGVNPHIVEQKLQAFLEPEAQGRFNEMWNVKNEKAA